MHQKIWFCLCRPVRRQEVRSAAFKQSSGQMFQFPTWRTGSADAKGTKRLLGIVATLRFLLPPPTLNLLPWSWTVWTGAVKLLCDQRAQSPQHVKAGRDFAPDAAGPSLPAPGFGPGMKVGRSAHRSRDSPSALPGRERQRCVRRLLSTFSCSSLCCAFNAFAHSWVLETKFIICYPRSVDSLIAVPEFATTFALVFLKEVGKWKEHNV